MALQQQAEAAQIDQDGGIGQGAAVIVGFGLAAESQAQRLGFRTPSEPERGLPQRHGAEHEQADGRHARCQHVAQQPAE